MGVVVRRYTQTSLIQTPKIRARPSTGQPQFELLRQQNGDIAIASNILRYTINHTRMRDRECAYFVHACARYVHVVCVYIIIAM